MRRKRLLKIAAAGAIGAAGILAVKTAPRALINLRAITATHPARQDLRIQGRPSISTATINSIVAKTPMQGKGELGFILAKKYNITPAFALGFFKQESGFGSRGLGAKNNNPGNITKIVLVKQVVTVLVKGKKTRRTVFVKKIAFQKFASIDEGIEAWFRMIANSSNYYRARKFSLEEIAPVYAPPSENPTQQYIEAIKKSAREFRQMKNN